MRRPISMRFLTCIGWFSFLILLPLFTRDNYVLGVFILMFFNIILAVTFRQVMNIGFMNITHISFMGFGAYTSGLLATKLGLNFWLCLPAAGLVAGVLALGMGFATLRVKGFYFVMMTTALVESVRMAIMNTPYEWAGGPVGLSSIPAPDPIVIPGLLIVGFDSRVNFYYLVLVAMLIFLIALYALETSRFGLIFRAIKQEDMLAKHVGINLLKYKVLNFVFSLTIVGMTGSFYVHYYSMIDPAGLGFMGTAWSIIYCVIGGLGSISGPIIGASIITVLLELLRPFKQLTPIPLGAILILMLLFMPEGIIGLPSRISKLGSRVRSRHGAEVAKMPE